MADGGPTKKKAKRDGPAMAEGQSYPGVYDTVESIKGLMTEDGVKQDAGTVIGLWLIISTRPATSTRLCGVLDSAVTLSHFMQYRGVVKDPWERRELFGRAGFIAHPLLEERVMTGCEFAFLPVICTTPEKWKRAPLRVALSLMEGLGKTEVDDPLTALYQVPSSLLYFAAHDPSPNLPSLLALSLAGVRGALYHFDSCVAERSARVQGFVDRTLGRIEPPTDPDPAVRAAHAKRGPSRAVLVDDFPVLLHLPLMAADCGVCSGATEAFLCELARRRRWVVCAGGAAVCEENVLRAALQVLGEEGSRECVASAGDDPLIADLLSGVPGDVVQAAVAHPVSPLLLDIRVLQPEQGCLLQTPLKEWEARRLPAGLRYLDDFVSEEEEQDLLRSMAAEGWGQGQTQTEKAMTRRVTHFGYKYRYPAGGMDIDAPLGPLPAWAERIARKIEAALGIREGILTQMTANEYEPGQGISAHIDCLSTIGEPLVTLSLGSPVAMAFSHGPTGRRLELLLRPRSLAVMCGDARKEWTHCIPKRKYDGTAAPRGTRVSLTYRSVPPVWL